MPHEPLQVDGDALGAGTLEAVVRPGALQVLVPPGPWPAASGEASADGVAGDPTASAGTPG
jgi:hypothetical protein